MAEQLFTYSEDEMRELVLQIYSRMIAYIRGFVGNGKCARSAEDIFQEALYRFLSKRAGLPKSKAPGYIYRISRNICLNLISRNEDEISALSLDELSAWDTLAQLDFEAPDAALTPLAPLASISPLDDSDASPDISEVLAYSEHFPLRTRNIFRMSRIEGMTHKEIADKLGISTRAVEKHLSKSVAEYRRHFGLKSDGRSGAS